jgi:hypothetical protein
MYCDRDETVVTWDVYSPSYMRITSKLPWILAAEERQLVEAAIKPCPAGGRFAFANSPRCPQCYESVELLVPSSE